MTIFIDFDDVLFNTQQFKDDLKNIFHRHGISNECYIKYYFPDGDGIQKTYDPRAQIDRICKNNKNINKDLLLKDVDEFLKLKTSRYIFEDVKNFCYKIGKSNLIVLSYGEKRMQSEKIANSEIDEFVADFIITDDLKSNAMNDYAAKKRMVIDENVVFIDDRVEQIADMKKYFPKIKTVWLHRIEGRYKDQTKDSNCDYEASSLLEVVELLK